MQSGNNAYGKDDPYALSSVKAQEHPGGADG